MFWCEAGKNKNRIEYQRGAKYLLVLAVFCLGSQVDDKVKAASIIGLKSLSA